MKPDEFKALINEIGSLIDKSAETTKIGIEAHVTKEIKAAEERIINHVHADIEAAEERTKGELKLDIHDLKTELVQKVKSNERRISNLEEKTETPNPHKN